jgi:histidyl-tRNA synthetase
MNVNLIKTPISGMRDFTPMEIKRRDYILYIIEQVARSYGYQKIETPATEHLENLTSKEGGENENLIFRILKRGQALEDAKKSGDELADSALRYDLTVPLARYFANNRNDLSMPFKALQIGPVWRADRPQKGRFRQFLQCDMDILGDSSILAEIDTISTTVEMLSRVFEDTDIPSIVVHLNDRKILTAAASFAGFDESDFSSILIELDKRDKVGLAKVKGSLIRLGFNPEKVGVF